MLNQLLAWDKAAFYYINQHLANSLFDWFFPLITSGKFWIVPAVVGAAFFIKNEKRTAGLVLLLAALLIGLTDPISFRVIKPFFERFRPCDPRAGLENVRALIGMRTSWSFPSSHAFNSFALAAFFSFLYPRRRIMAIAFTIAALVGFSRVYVGVHYPLDVAGGAVMGAIMGLTIAVLGNKFVLKRPKT